MKKSGIFVKQIDPAANIAEVSTEETNQNWQTFEQILVGKNQDINQEQFQTAVSGLPNTRALQVQNKLNE